MAAGRLLDDVSVVSGVNSRAMIAGWAERTPHRSARDFGKRLWDSTRRLRIAGGGGCLGIVTRRSTPVAPGGDVISLGRLELR